MCFSSLNSRQSKSGAIRLFVVFKRIKGGVAGSFAIKNGKSHKATPSDTSMEPYVCLNCPKNKRIVTNLESWNLYGFMILSICLGSVNVPAFFSIVAEAVIVEVTGPVSKRIGVRLVGWLTYRKLDFFRIFLATWGPSLIHFLIWQRLD